MVAYKNLPLLALVGSVVAAPVQVVDVVTAVVTDIVTAQVTQGQAQAAEYTPPAQQAPPAYTVVVTAVAPPAYTYGPPPSKPSAPASHEHHYSHPAPTSSPPPPPPVVTPTPTPQSYQPAPPASSSTPSSGSSGNGGVENYMATVNEWRGKLGLPTLTRDTQLEANALKTCTDDNGTMKHELNAGSFAQVLAPGQLDQFVHVFVGGWLCEMPDMPGMDGICATASSGWAYDGTGHAQILSSKSYTKIGCAQNIGIWGCDLA